MSGIDEIRQSIDDHLRKTEAEIAVLSAALDALDRDGSPRRRGTRSAARAAAPRRQTREAPVVSPPAPPSEHARPVRRRRADLTGAHLEALLTPTGEGLSADELARQLSASPDRVLSVLRGLEARGRVRREGSRRTNRWVAIRSEERIAPPSPELAERSEENRGRRPRQRRITGAKSARASRTSSKGKPERSQSQQESSASASTAPQAPSSEDNAESERGSAVSAANRRAETISADEVLSALRDGRRTASAIAEHLGVPVSMVRQRLRELQDAGRIRRRPHSTKSM